MILYNN